MLIFWLHVCARMTCVLHNYWLEVVLLAMTTDKYL
jgi:hypothetical protein